MEYIEPKYCDQDQAVVSFKHPDSSPDVVVESLLAWAASGKDLDVLEKWAVFFLHHRNFNIARASVLCFGYLAMHYRSKFPQTLCDLLDSIESSRKELSSVVSDICDDIDVFRKKP